MTRLYHLRLNLGRIFFAHDYMGRSLTSLLLCLFVLGCDDEDGNSREWEASFILAGAINPVISTSETPDRFLYYAEGQGGGLFIHHEDGATQRLTPEGVSARTDAVWSADGESFAFSIPGEPGIGETGVYFGGLSVPPRRVWDRGSDPTLDADGERLFFSGPENDPEYSGIWMADLLNENVVLWSEIGIKPKWNPVSSELAYLLPLASSNGSALYVEDDLRAMYVADYAWLPSTGELIYETASNQISEVLPQTIYRIGPNDALPGEVILRDATNICAVGGDVLLNQVSGDLLGSLVLRAGQKTIEISDSLWRASATSTSVILASGPSGISKLVER